MHFIPPNLISNFLCKFEKLKQGLAKCSAKIKGLVFLIRYCSYTRPLATSRQTQKSKMTMKKFIEKGNANPKKLFQIDGFGAILSATLLGIVLVKFERFFGIPVSTLYFLASLPIFFAIYDFYIYYRIDKNLGKYLKVIGIINLMYCFLSIGLAIYDREEITNLGWIYILTEIFIVSTVAIIELGVAKRQLESRKT